MARRWIACACLVFPLSCRESPVAPVALALSMTLQVSAQVAEGVLFRWVAKNSSDRAVRVPIYGANGLAFDAYVRREDDTEVWRRIGGLIAGAGAVLELAPNDSSVFSATWDLRDESGQKLLPGTYFVVGLLLGEHGETITRTPNPATLVIPAQQ